MTANPENLILEPAAPAFAEATSEPPFLFFAREGMKWF